MSRARLVQKDLPDDLFDALKNQTELGVDCEMMGLNPWRDRLCLIQIAAENGPCALVQVDENEPPARIQQLFENPAIQKIFHFARLDCLFLRMRVNIQIQNVFCTKIASRLGRTYTDRHGLKEVVREFTGETLDKQITSSDWGSNKLTDDQLHYAASDVIYLFAVKRGLTEIINREGRAELLRASLEYLPHRVELDRLGYDSIFQH
ncbi:MAG: ribonuclease D [Spirochaetaceae bacterium]|nr:ribonuclease D [Spirochaetaceae bacterium]|tara:strand:+ start:34140 stop:34757 length:618 start_codon:yes stop_codon:yes gene_type:complete